MFTSARSASYVFAVEVAASLPKADAARHYAIARGSAMEAAAVLDVIGCLGVLGEARHRHGLEFAARIIGMLTSSADVTVAVAVAVDDQVNVNDNGAEDALKSGTQR